MDSVFKNSAAVQGSALYYTSLPIFTLYWIKLLQYALYCTVLNYNAICSKGFALLLTSWPRSTILYCIWHYCTTLHCATLTCTAVQYTALYCKHFTIIFVLSCILQSLRLKCYITVIWFHFNILKSISNVIIWNFCVTSEWDYRINKKYYSKKYIFCSLIAMEQSGIFNHVDLTTSEKPSILDHHYTVDHLLFQLFFVSEEDCTTCCVWWNKHKFNWIFSLYYVFTIGMSKILKYCKYKFSKKCLLHLYIYKS